MTRFAKLIELRNNEQVLLTIDYSVDNDVYDMLTRTNIKGISVSIKSNARNMSNAIEWLDNYSLEDAESFRTRINRLLL
ncbi:hypothetical protein BN863_28800 [Formosa agariphila KMM 3901]|uniref:Uncharacterized protein n=1 Tax=Formosa agariphila (strain DSM 15362 / KCTC 12365 / LMG 23005 / KMM 3901 / M-2Alg 35-1) TaxID=1347342 RepID=T2KP01_FORAG|nr:hypothetical protein [Formosa agariphila]CDF80592.1 hypothetical protein BN863_28800 [Formosa agariphila KMM 3901]